ncbi:MAG: hypothetical protein A2V99_04475 [Spirochaetes bacterium RBG_16_67_19]|nr:MAG: hypothetical protein A2064_00110 [Spirochaetes bacterium GWB1_66_5]OHD76822.1 MAG: hypothetical protein A2V99_04475 [Spirochaetes bacterium RBG_16_67_19]
MLRGTLAVVLILCLGAAPVFAQQEDYQMGKLQGEVDARGQAVWILSGLFLGPIGLILPWVINPRVPGANLIGKSAEWVAGYMDGYRHEAKPKNFLYSLVGFAVWGAAAVALAVGLSNAANSSANACGESCGSSCGDVFDNWATDACSSSSCSPQLSLR